ncbi:hypothetical protein ABZW03_17755, partial [Kitasatospora sp. NPDC004799]
MFYLRLARGYRVPDLGRWLLTALAAAVVAAFLLRSLGRAMSDPTGGDDPLAQTAGVSFGITVAVVAVFALGIL